MRVSTPPPASSAGSDDANRIRWASSVRYSGLMPSRSRPSSTRPLSRSTIANANMPVQVVDEAVAPVVVGLEQHLGVAVREEPVAVAGQFVAQVLVVVDAAVPADGQARGRNRPSAGAPASDRSMIFRRRWPSATRPCDHTPAPSGPRGAIASAMAETAADIRRLAVETHLAGGSTHSARPYPQGCIANLSAAAPRSCYETPSSCSPVSSTCLIGPVNHFFTDACQ